MTRDHQHNPDPNVNAHRIGKEATRDESKTPTDLESAWQKWPSHIQKVAQAKQLGPQPDERIIRRAMADFHAGNYKMIDDFIAELRSSEGP